MKIGSIELSPPFALAPMAGMTDTAFRRLVKRKGGCGLVVSEMVCGNPLPQVVIPETCQLSSDMRAILEFVFSSFVTEGML